MNEENEIVKRAVQLLTFPNLSPIPSKAHTEYTE